MCLCAHGQVPSLPYGGPDHIDVASSSSVSSENGEIIMYDKDEKKITLGDAISMTRVKDAYSTSVEELQNLAGGADIEGLKAVLDKAVHIEDGKKVPRGIDLESMNIGYRDALLLFHTLCKMAMKEEIDEVTSKTRLLSLELLQVDIYTSIVFLFLFILIIATGIFKMY